MANLNTQTTALVTGATSGLGYEAAAQLADAGYDTVIITGRTNEGAAAAAAELTERTGKDVFRPLAIDFNEPADIDAAVDSLEDGGRAVTFLLLNAGMVAGSTRTRTPQDVEVTFSSSVVGHHRLTMSMLGRGLLGPSASIVIAGSEAARGDVPTFKPTDLHALAAEGYDGDLVDAAEALIRGDDRIPYKSATSYADAKVFVARWAAELARRLPDGMVVNAVSPGSAPDTKASRNAEGFMKYVLIPAFKYAPKWMGMSAPVSDAAGRYLEVGRRRDVSGEFFASAPGKMTGPVEVVDLPHLRDPLARRASWDAIVAVAGGVDYPAAA